MENRAGAVRIPSKSNLQILLCLFFSVHFVTSFSLSKGISQTVVRADDGMQNFTLKMGDEINRIELNILKNSTKYWFLMDDSVHFCRQIMNSHNSDDSSEEDEKENEEEDDKKKPKCSVKLSFSLLKMKCKENDFLEIARVSTDKKSGKPIYEPLDDLCKNDEYIYHAADSEKHFIADIEAEEKIILTPRGGWAGDATHAKILVSLHYEINNKECPSNFFDCNANCKEDSSSCKLLNSRLDKNKLKSICIPNTWLCDKLPNCGAIYDDADEAQGLCFWDENGNESTSDLRKLENVLIAMIDVIFYGLIPLFIICLLFKILFRKYVTSRNTTSGSGNNNVNGNVNAGSPDLEVSQGPSTFGTYFNSRRKSEEPPSYDEVVVQNSETSTGQSTTRNEIENGSERRCDAGNQNQNLPHPRT